MKFKGVFQAPVLRVEAYKRRLEKELTEAITQAAFEWLHATVEEVPVWSGASRATFLPLASAISFQVPIDRNPKGRRGGFTLGLNNADGDVTIDVGSGKFEFKYSTTLEHLIYNEFNNGNAQRGPGQFGELINPGPYHFTVKGRLAFQNFARGVRLPDIRDSITTKPIRVG